MADRRFRMRKDLDEDRMEPSSRHLTHDELRDLLAERLPQRKLAEGLLHLAACLACRRRFQQAFPSQAPACFRRWFGTATPPQGQNIPQPHFDVAIRWGSELVRTAVREMEEAKTMWKDIEHLAAEHRRLLVLNMRKFHTLGFSVVLLNVARETWLNEPEEALSLADLAASILRRSTTSAQTRRINDLQGRAMAFRANCHRILSQLGAARRDFDRAHALLDDGTGDPVERAEVLEHEATLLRDLRRLEDSKAALEKAALHYHEAGDVRGEARMIVKLALVLREAGRVEAGILEIEKLLTRHDAGAMGNDTFVRCHHNLLLLAIDAGMLDKARSRLPRVQRLVYQRNNRFDLIRLKWLEALLHDKSGEDQEAEAKYRQVQQFFLGEGIGYDAAFVSLDLAAFYLDRSRHRKARGLAAELTPIFLADDIHREAVATLLLFREALDREEATAALARATAKALREVQGRPPHRRESIH